MVKATKNKARITVSGNTKTNGDTLPVTKSLGKNCSAGRKLTRTGDNSKAQSLLSASDPGALAFFRSRQSGSKGINATLAKYAQSQSIKINDSEATQFLNHTTKKQPNYNDIAMLETVHISKCAHWMWLSFLKRNTLIYGIGDKDSFIARFVSEYLDNEDVITVRHSRSSHGDRIILNILVNILKLVGQREDLFDGLSIISAATICTGIPLSQLFTS